MSDKATIIDAALSEAEAVTWAAVAKIAEKTGDRDKIPGGATHGVELDIRSLVDGQKAVDVHVRGSVAAGHPFLKASSVAPTAKHLTAYFLTLLPERRRATVIKNLPGLFEKQKALPGVTEQSLEIAQNLLEKLRAAGDPQEVRGALSVHYALA